MLKILMDGMCSGCEYADLELDYLEHIDGRKVWSLKCIHRKSCDNMETKTIIRVRKSYRSEEIKNE